MELNSPQKKIVLISSGQPSLNPRLVKEADSLSDAGYRVTVLYAYWNAWGTAADKDLLLSKKWKAIRAGGDPEEQRITYFLSRLIHKLSLLITKKTGINYFAKFAIARSSFFLIREAKRHEADLYIGHNLGALPAITEAVKINKKHCGFDIEDFHRYELSNNNNDADVILKTYIENKYIPQTDYLSASSKPIANAYTHLFPGKNPVVLMNVFSQTPDLKPLVLNQSGPVKLFWFSQTIGINRGIADIVNALQLTKNGQFELHLLGDHSPEMIDQINKLNSSNATLHYHRPISSSQLVEFASRFDIGLALEPGFSTNNDFALSNKIFTYMQAGLAIVLSDTTAQKELHTAYPSIGKMYKKENAKMLAEVIEYYFYNRDELAKTKKATNEIARTELNWEKESKKLLKVIADTLAN